MTTSPDPGDLLPSSPRLRAGLDELWSVFTPEVDGGYGLIPSLAFDAVWARATGGEADACTPRLMELMVEHNLSIVESRQVMDLLADTARESTDGPELAVQRVLDAWWAQALLRDGVEQAPGYPPAVVLGLVARWPASMSRWLGPWVDQLDGPGARHLIDALAAVELNAVNRDPDVVSVPSTALMAEAWRGADDQLGQFRGWARSETVVNGLVLVGATHLKSGHYGALSSDVVDSLLEA